MINNIYKTGDVLHCKSKSFISGIIRKLTKGTYSHTAIVVDIWGQNYVVGAQKNGVNPRLFDEWIKEYNYEFTVSRPKEVNEKEISRKIFSEVGHSKYDFFALIIAHPIFLLTGKWIGNKSKEIDKYYCSKFVAWVYNLPKWYELNPQAVFEYMNDDKDFTTL